MGTHSPLRAVVYAEHIAARETVGLTSAVQTDSLHFSTASKLRR